MFILFKRNLAHSFQQLVKCHCWCQCTIQILKEAKQFRQLIWKNSNHNGMWWGFFLCLMLSLLWQDILRARNIFSVMENHSFLLLAYCPSSPASSLTSQLKQLTGWWTSAQLPINLRPHYSVEKILLDLKQQSLLCLYVHSHEANTVSFLRKFLHLRHITHIDTLSQVEIPVLWHFSTWKTFRY